MIIAFTGSQSSGKSTLLSALQSDPDFKDWAFEAEITRQLKAKYNLNINENGDDVTQIATIYSHLDNYLRNKDRDAVFDRCSIDALVYTTYLYYNKKISYPVGDFAELVHSKLRTKYDIVFYTDPSIPLVDDGVRSNNEEFRNKIIELFEEFIKNDKEIYNQKVPPMYVVRLKGDVEQRTATIKKAVDLYRKGDRIIQ